MQGPGLELADFQNEIMARPIRINQLKAKRKNAIGWIKYHFYWPGSCVRPTLITRMLMKTAMQRLVPYLLLVLVLKVCIPL
jgi:hypothetical protein